LKTIPNSFSWFNRKHWYWPDIDEKLIQVNDWVRDADLALKYIKNKNVCVQAGGACGVWPAYLSTHFKKVITFEPVKDNYDCLKLNTEEIENISFFNAALGDKNTGNVSMNLDRCEKNNAGAYYMTDGGKIPCTYIDKLKLKACDFIALDIEGFEHLALMGAENTIIKYKPVIMLEEKPLPHLKNNEHLYAREYLLSMGYKQVDQIHRDAVFIHA
jgi:FkbM family methyltransferase